MKRNRVALVVACVALTGAVLVGGWALLLAGPDDSSSAGPGRGGAGKASASASDSATAKPEEDQGISSFTIPRTTVDPTSGRTYCDTVRLLAIYSRQGYGLNQDQGVVDGRKFDTRLKVTAMTFARLAEQAAENPRAGGVGRHWRALATITTATEEKLRVNGLQVQSQSMIVQLARLAHASKQHLPPVARTLQAACGYAPAVLGL